MAEAEVPRLPPRSRHSASALKKLVDQLTCPVCLEDYSDPRVLHCLHHFCRSCLDSLAKRCVIEGAELLFVTCPICRKETKIDDIGNLPTAFYLESLLEIRKDLEGSCESGAGQKSITTCSTHSVSAEFYCKTCDMFLCNVCICGEHKDHSFELISALSQKEGEELELKLRLLDSKVASVEQAMDEVDRNCRQVHDEERSIQESIHSSCVEAHQLINDREKRLMEDLHAMTEQKLLNLEVRRDQLQVMDSRLKSCREIVQEGLQLNTTTETLRMKKTFLPLMEDISRQHYELSTKVTRLNRIAFVADKSALDTLSGYGTVYIKCPKAENCIVQGDGLSKAKVGKLVVIKLCLYDQRNQEFEIDPSLARHMISAGLYSCTGSYIVQCSIEVLNGNECTIKYVPTMKGAHSLHLEVLGHPVPGSPFCVSVKAPLSAVSHIPLNIITDLSLPWGVVVDGSSGQLCVAESGKKKAVLVCGHSGERISTVVKGGILSNLLEEPSGVAFDKKRNVIIADFRLSTVQRVTREGQVLQSVGCSGSKETEFTYPSALAVNPTNNKIYVAEWEENDRVHILNSDMSHSHMFGQTGSRSGEFLCPSGVAFDKAGNVYVADCNNGRIQVFTSEGAYLREFGREGSKDEKLRRPMGLCIDQSSDVLYITDVHYHRVFLFTTAGQFLKSFGRYGSGPGEFNKPQGIVVDEFRFIYVCDTFNNRIQVF